MIFEGEDPTDLFKLLEMIRNKQEELKGRTINAHYGVKEELFAKWANEMLCDMIMNNNKSDVLDKWFPNGMVVDGEAKIKIVAYAGASDRFLKMEGLK